MNNPLADVIALLRPRAVFAKSVSGAGAWSVLYPASGRPSFCVVLAGACKLAIDGQEAVTLEEGDFVFLPATPGLVLSSLESAVPVRIDPNTTSATMHEVRLGTRGRPDVRMLGGYFEFDSPDAALLTSLFPALIHVRGVERFSTLVRMVAEESKTNASGSDLVLARLVELLLIEALRGKANDDPLQGLVGGLADERVAHSIRHMHGDPARAWTVALLAKKAALSRSTFYERFVRAVGMPPIEYLLAWRMVLAKDLLRRRDLGIEEVAKRVGYRSARTFNIAFTRHVGQSPGRYARQTQRRI